MCMCVCGDVYAVCVCLCAHLCVRVWACICVCVCPYLSINDDLLGGREHGHLAGVTQLGVVRRLELHLDVHLSQRLELQVQNILTAGACTNTY